MPGPVQQMIEAADGFWVDVAAREARLRDMVLLSGRYDPGRFSHDLFDAMGIACPESLLQANPRRLAEFLAGRALAKIALGLIDVPYADIAIAPDRRPRWPDSVVGSISHARGHAACLIGKEPSGHPGIDIETIAHGQSLRAIEKIVLTDFDRRLVDDLPMEQTGLLTTLVFSAKEALFKALFPMVGKVFGFAAAELVAVPDDGQMTLRLTADLTPHLPKGALFTLHCYRAQDHVMTWLCARDDRLQSVRPAMHDGA